jgi:uncharacterized protein
MVAPRPIQSETEFASILRENIRPAQPMDSPALLQGREPLLRDIGRSLQSPGMHVFIHGERGIGKTSLALTTAKSALGEEPPYVGCEKATTFQTLVVDICDVLLDRKHLERDTKISGGASFGALGFKAEAKVDGTHKLVRPDEIGSINQAAALIAECVQRRGKDKSVLIIDELDRVVSPDFRNQLSELIKRVHDTRVGLKLIMCALERPWMKSSAATFPRVGRLLLTSCLRSHLTPDGRSLRMPPKNWDFSLIENSLFV